MSYLRQADDDTLQKHAMRIQARATRRCGELLKEFDARPTNAQKQSAAANTLISQRDAAEQAGLSKRQQVTAVRVAAVPEDQFEEVVESDTPPTVTKLADWGRKPHDKPDWAREMQVPEQFYADQGPALNAYPVGGSNQADEFRRVAESSSIMGLRISP